MTYAGTPYGVPYVPDPTQVQQRPQVAYQPAAASAGVGGRLLADFGAPQGAEIGWYVRRITVTASMSGNAYVYVGTANDPASLVDGTGRGYLDTAEYLVPFYVPSGQHLWVMWDATTGTAGARVEYVQG